MALGVPAEARSFGAKREAEMALGAFGAKRKAEKALGAEGRLGGGSLCGTLRRGGGLAVERVKKKSGHDFGSGVR